MADAEAALQAVAGDAAESRAEYEVENMDTEESSSTLSPEVAARRLGLDVAKHWRDFGLKAELTQEELQSVEDESIENCLLQVLKVWEGKQPLTWQDIVKVLTAVGDNSLAKQLAEEQGVPWEEDSASGPSCSTQKTEIRAALQQRLKKGDTWYLVDVRWMKQWKKYVGYDQWDQSFMGQESASPGPMDNSNLFKENAETLKEHLMEELDYYLLPESAWEKLSSWYGISQGSHPVPRKVVEHGLYMKHCKVEVYLLEFKLCTHAKQGEIVCKQFSRSSTVADLEEQLKEVFSVAKDAECRVWHRYMTNTYELLSNSSQTLQDAGLYNGQTIVLEMKKEDGNWPRNTQVTPSSHNPTRSTDDNFPTPSSSISRGSSSTSGYSSGGASTWNYNQKPTSPGLCGLSNLGNTCFMNSALQCLSNTVSLTEYFLGTLAGYKPYKKHINKNNPLGMGGAIAEAYGALLEDMWLGKFNCVAPRQFKTQVGRYAPQFVGYAQHDSQELLAFLLDGLHEDLNLVREKPYVDMTVNTEGRSDKEVAEETWLKYMLRNQSVIVRLFQGQLKSTLNCPDCHTTSKTFDPFMFLSLPLPIKKTRNISVRLVSIDPDAPLKKFKLQLPKRGGILDLKTELEKLCGVKAAQMIVVDVYNARFHRVYTDRDSLSLIMDRDDIFVYELSVCSEGQDMIHLPVYHREETVKDVRYSSSSYQQRYFQLFGIPLVVMVPRECTFSDIYKAVLEKGRRYIKTWKQHKNETIGKEVDGDDSGEQDKDQNMTEDSSVSEEVRSFSNGVIEDRKDDDAMEEGEKSDDNERLLFQLVVVNSYGSQEVQKLELAKTYKLSGQTYIACDWQADVREKCYDKEIAEQVVKDDSCVAAEVRKNIDLMDCLKLFAQTETLSKDDAWYCPNCKEFVQATKKFDLWRLPDTLVIHLKRFSYDRYWRDKLDVMVDFPVSGLDLTGLVHSRDDPQPLYDLFAVSNHFGGMGGGHYTAYAKNKTNQKWYNFDDSHVAETAESNLMSAYAYVLFYQRRTEGRPVNILDRSLSQSFAEERKILSSKYKAAPANTLTEEETIQNDEGKGPSATNDDNEVFETELNEPD